MIRRMKAWRSTDRTNSPNHRLALRRHRHRRKLVKISGGGARGTRIIGGRRSLGHHGECRARAYNGGLAEPPAGSRGRAPGQGGEAPPEAESILVIGCPTEPANLAPFLKCLALQGMNGLTVDLSALRKTNANN